MKTLVQPSCIKNGDISVPLDFPYMDVFLQGRPQHVSDEFSIKHPQMERGKRAKIFSPFDALDGYGEAVRSKNVEYTDKVELDESEKEELNRRLSILHDLTYNKRMAKKNHVVVTVTYYVPCLDENSFAFGFRGEYKKKTGIISCVDTELTQTIIVGMMPIRFEDIVEIESEEQIFDHFWEDVE